MALAALGAVPVLDVGFSTAEAAPSVSPFAGTYVDASGVFPTTITISDGGRITGHTYSGGTDLGSISGRVSDDGSYSYTVTESGISDDDDGFPRGGRKRWRSTRTLDGNMTLDAAGNIVASGGTGGSFVWFRQ